MTLFFNVVLRYVFCAVLCKVLLISMFYPNVKQPSCIVYVVQVTPAAQDPADSGDLQGQWVWQVRRAPSELRATQVGSDLEDSQDSPAVLDLSEYGVSQVLGGPRVIRAMLDHRVLLAIPEGLEILAFRVRVDFRAR